VIFDSSFGTIANTLPPAREFRDIQVKVHIRRPEKDSWAYLGRALVSQEVVGQSSRVGERHYSPDYI
jgi:hypothetical protein